MHTVSRLVQFSHFLETSLDDFAFYLDSLVSACDRARHRFLVQEESDPDEAKHVRRAFTQVLWQAATIFDVLQILAGKQSAGDPLRQLPHGPFIRDSRNAVTHDGNPMVNLWVDGRYYIAVPIVRTNHLGKEVVINPPVVDVGTIAMEFSSSLETYLRERLEPILASSALQGPLYGKTFFDQAIHHPAIPEVIREQVLKFALPDDAPELQGDAASLLRLAIARFADQVLKLRTKLSTVGRGT